MDIDTLQEIFITRMKSQEIFFLLKSMKKVVRQGFYPEELEKVEQFCKDNSLHCIRSEFKVVTLDDDKRFSNKGIRVKLDDPRRGMMFLYISKEEILAYKASYFEIKQDHHSLGLILGYPNCCSMFFEENSVKKEHGDNDFQDIVLKGSAKKDYPFVMNIFKRQDDYCILSHFPCSLDCEESLKIGKRYFEALPEQYSKEVKKQLATDYQMIRFS